MSEENINEQENGNQTNEEIKTENVQKVETKKKKRLRTKLVLLFLVLTIIIGYIAFRGSYLETLEIGEKYLNVYWNNIKYKTATFVIEFVVLFIATMLGTKGIKKGLKAFFEDEKKDMPKLPGKSIAFIVSLIVSALTLNTISEKIVLVFNSASFGLTDPIFKLDIGYYIFQKPFIQLIIFSLIAIAIGLAIYTAIYYIIVFNKYFDGIDRKTLKHSKLIKQLLRYLRIATVGLALLIILNTQNVLFEKLLTLDDKQSTALYGAGMTDVFIKIAGYIILSIVVVISVFRAIRYFLKKDTKSVIKSLAIVPGYLVCLFVVLFGFQLIFVSPNELEKEKAYIENNIEATKNAYGLNINEQEINNLETISIDQIKNNQNVLDNIAIVDEDITLSTLTDKQSKLQYYTYLNSKMNLYKINGKEKLVYLSARELSSINSSSNSKTYGYTHGFGTVVTSASSMDETGNIEYIQKEFDGSDEKINVTEPRIYYGTQTKQTIITNSKSKKEFDYPISDTENAENSYEGKGGIKLGFFDRLILGIYKRDLKIVFSSEISKDSKILINRNITERAKKILPEIMYDEEPYQVITNDGKTVWVLDGYTTSTAYPYSQSSIIEVKGYKQRINYIRNSVKVIIDCYDGTIKFYITDRTDPIIMAYRNLYPELFENIDESIPRDIAEHITYSKFLYNIQARVIERYHNVKTDVLYRSNDVWAPATHVAGKTLTTTGTEIEPYYTMVKTIDSEKEELGLVLPYTITEKQSLTSYLVGTIDENGKNVLKIYKFADDSNVLGTMQLDTQIEQNSEISAELKALSVSGTKIIRNIVVVPIDNTLLYVEPIYQVMLNESEVPVLKKIIVASGNKVAIGNNLTETIENLTSQYATKIEVTNTDNKDDLINEIIKANNNLTNSNASNNWELIGTDLSKLQELINELEEKIKEEEKENKNNTTVETNTIDTNSVNTVNTIR